MPPLSYATERKLKIIREQLGDDWQEQRPGQSIDAVYNDLMGDRRKTLFCKIDPRVKEHLDEMTKDHQVKIAEFLEGLIEKQYTKHVEERERMVATLARQYSES